MGKEFAGVVTRKVRSLSRKAYSRRKKGGEDCSLLLRVGGIKISAVSCIYNYIVDAFYHWTTILFTPTTVNSETVSFGIYFLLPSRSCKKNSAHYFPFSLLIYFPKRVPQMYKR
jgi:hypothetical protein